MKEDAGRPVESPDLYIAWTGFQRRAESLRARFGLEVGYFPTTGSGLINKGLSYIRQAWAGLAFVRGKRPQRIWLQTPPNFLVHLFLLARGLGLLRANLIIDAHNATFRPPWSRIPLLWRLINQAGVVVVHNDEVAKDAIQLGVLPDRLVVLTDPLPVIQPTPPAMDLPTLPYFVMPCSFNPDEPIATVLAVARQVPEAQFVLTGNRRKLDRHGLGDDLPPNVIFPGFLAMKDLDNLLLGAHGILCLTTIEGIQLSAAVEALAAGRPMILSNTTILREMFGSAAVLVENDSGSIAHACRSILADPDGWSQRSRDLHAIRTEEWSREMEALRQHPRFSRA